MDSTRQERSKDAKASGLGEAVISRATPVRIQLGILISLLAFSVGAAAAWFNFQAKVDRQNDKLDRHNERIGQIADSVSAQTDAIRKSIDTLHSHNLAISTLKQQQDFMREDYRELKRRLDREVRP